MRIALVLAGLLLPFTFALPSARAGKRATVDHRSPVKVTRAVFRAARTKNAQLVRRLCDPKGQNDGDTRRLCSVKRGTKGWQQFLKYFAKGRVTGKAVIQGNRAKVPFRFGPRGKRSDTMNLVRRGKFWYLYSF